MVGTASGIEVELFHDFMLATFIFSLAITIFGAATSSTLPASTAGVASLNKTLTALRNAGTGISTSFNATLLSNVQSSDFFYPVEVFINGVWKFGAVGLALLGTVWVTVTSAFYLVFVVIPGILPSSAFGSGWGTFFGYIYVFVTAVLIVYASYLVAVILGIRKERAVLT